MPKNSPKGFTLAELLIALMILGLIATFTIPKIITAQQNSSHNSIAKEGAAMLGAAYQLYKLENIPDANTTIMDLTPYLNYVAVDTATVIDHYQTSTTRTCGTHQRCLRLHNGSILSYTNGTASFGGTAPTSSTYFQIDPDGKVTDGTTNGPGKCVEFRLYYSGRVSTHGVHSGNPAIDPPWFTW